MVITDHAFPDLAIEEAIAGAADGPTLGGVDATVARAVLKAADGPEVRDVAPAPPGSPNKRDGSDFR